MERSTALVIGATAAIGIAALYYWSVSGAAPSYPHHPVPIPMVPVTEHPGGSAPSSATAPSPSSETQNPTLHGLVLQRDRIEIVSWSDWMDFAPPCFVEAIASGLGKPDQILAFVMRRVFPALRWPPAADSPYRESWDRLAARVDQALPRVAADGSPPLRVL